MSYLDYADSFSHKIENIQYRASLVITGAIQGASRDKFYQELGLESLSVRRWYEKLAFCYEIIYNLSLTYITAYLSNNVLPPITPGYHMKILFGIYYVEWKTLKIQK